MRWLGAGFAGALMWASSARADDAPIKIGVMNDMSSVYAVAGGRETVEAVRMAIDDAGPVLGKRAELIFADHQNKPDVGSNIARQWFDVDHVDAILDVPTSSVALAVAAMLCVQLGLAVALLLFGSMRDSLPRGSVSIQTASGLAVTPPSLSAGPSGTLSKPSA